MQQLEQQPITEYIDLEEAEHKWKVSRAEKVILKTLLEANGKSVRRSKFISTRNDEKGKQSYMDALNNLSESGFIILEPAQKIGMTVLLSDSGREFAKCLK